VKESPAFTPASIGFVVKTEYATATVATAIIAISMIARFLFVWLFLT